LSDAKNKNIFIEYNDKFAIIWAKHCP